MPSSSSSSGSSSESGSSLAPTRKRKHVEADSSDSSAPDTNGSADEDEAQPQPRVTEDTTVLSHAERRRQKKREKQHLAASSEAPRKKRKLADETAATKTKTKTTTTTPAADDPTRQKRQNSVWVGNLSFRTTQDALRGFFDGVGTITRIHMPMRHGKQMQGENMGFAYVDFDTPEAKVIAITLSEGQLDGRNLLIKDGDDFTGRPVKARTDASEAGGVGEGGAQGDEKVAKKGTDTITTTAAAADGKGLSKTAQKILRTQKQPPAPTLFLGNLGFETTETSIRELFEAHRYWGRKGKKKGEGKGEEEVNESEEKDKSKDVWIRKIRMGTFEDSGNCKGFAFVDFTSIEHATAALVNPRNHRLNGRDLVVEYASPDAVRRGGGGPRKTKGDQSSRIAQKGSSVNAPYTKQRRPRHSEQEDDADVTAETTTPSRRPDRAGHDRPHTRRAKPGAALAHAERQSAAILPSQGQKIVF